MRTCNNCLHNDFCNVDGYIDADECKVFKDKAEYVQLSEVKKVIMDYIFDQTVSKYPTAELCRASRMGAEGVIYALENAFGAKMDGEWEEER